MKGLKNPNPRNPDTKLYKNLTRLLSGPLVVYRSQLPVQGKRRFLDKYGSKFRSASGQQFKRSQHNPFDHLNANMIANQVRSERYIDFDQMEYEPIINCITKDSVINTPSGDFTIERLLEMYPNGENFSVYAYDESKGCLTVGNAHSVRYTKTDQVYKVTLDSGESIRCTSDHKFLTRDGNWVEAKDLKEEQPLMPFYRKYVKRDKGYPSVYTINDGWQREYRFVAEKTILGRKLGEYPVEVVHHVDHNKSNSNPDNLQVVSAKEHAAIHGRDWYEFFEEERRNKIRDAVSKANKGKAAWNKNLIGWLEHTPEARRKISKKMKAIWEVATKEEKEKMLFGMRKWMKSDIGKEVMSQRRTKMNLEMWKDEEFVERASERSSKHMKDLWDNEDWAIWKKEHHSEVMKKKYQEDPEYYKKSVNYGDKNGRFNKAINTEFILTSGAQYEDFEDFLKDVDLGEFKTKARKRQFVLRRLMTKGFDSWKDYKENYVYENHKVVSVEKMGIEDVYDLTTDVYHNFACSGVIIHNSALDMYADEITTSSALRKMLTINSSNGEIKSILQALYYDVLNVDFNLYQWARAFCKYGDFFLYLDIDEDIGIQSVIGLPSSEIERLEGEDKTNPSYIQYQWNSAGMTFENWQIAHFRNVGNEKFVPYGSSVLEGARRIWRQVILLEDAMMAYRIVRSPERKAFYIDVGNIPPQETEQFVQKTITEMKRNQLIDSSTGRVDLRYNPFSIEEDYFIPVRGGTSQTRIESIPGGQYTGDIDDVKYLKDKLFAALKVPQSYLFRGEGAEEDKTTLAQKDIRFSRTIQRLQRAIISELEKIGIIHLYTLGYRGSDLISFTLSLNNPSKIAELQELEYWRTKFDVASAAVEGYFSKRWISEHLFGMSDEEFLRNQREMFYDRKFEAALAVAAEDEGEGDGGLEDFGGGGGAFGGGFEDEEGMGGEAELEDLEGGEDMDELPLDDGGGDGGDEDVLLAAPAKRDDDEGYVTPGSKGKKYKPVASDKRSMGARKRHMKGQYASELGSNTPRNTHKGYGDLKSLSKGIFEQEERKLMQTQREIEFLVESLKTKESSVITENVAKAVGEK
jgi:intein/homing endonuclease